MVKDKSIQLAELKDYYPLSPQQKRLYSLHQLVEQKILYNIQMMDIYVKGIEKEKIEEAFKKLIKRHESLRTSFHVIEGEVVQKIHDFGAVSSTFVSEYWKTAEDGMIYSEEPGKEWTKVTGLPFQDVVEHFIRPFDLKKPPLLRVGLIKIWGNTKILMMDMHNIVSDHISLELLIRDIWVLYEGEELPSLKLQYKDYSEWLYSEKRLETQKDLEEFWLEEFAGEIPLINLPTDYPRPATPSFEGNRVYFELDREETELLKKLELNQEVTLFMVFLAIYNVFLSKISGQEDIVIGTSIAGRRQPDLEHTIGVFVNRLALRNYPQKEMTFFDFLKEIKQNTLLCYENQDFPIESLIEKLELPRDTSRNPLFDVALELVNEADRPDEYLLEVLALDKASPYNLDSRYDMTLIGGETGNGVEFSIEYKTKLFKEETIKKFAGDLKRIISSVCKNTGQKISEIEIIPGEKKSQKNVYLDELEFKARSMIKDGYYPQARSNLEEIIEEAPERKQVIQKEFGFLYNFNDTLENDEKSWKEKGELLQYWRKLWILLADNNQFILNAKKSINKKIVQTPGEKTLSRTTKKVSPGDEDIKKSPGKLGGKQTEPASHIIGEILENAVLELFRKFFTIAEYEQQIVLEKLRKQKKGPQFGHDISFECKSKDNEKVVCKIECKNMKADITEKDISYKLLAVGASDQKIDHWILLSARSDPSSYLNELLASWREKEVFPFEIHIWSPENGIAEFFGLEPGIYDEFYGNATINNTHPRDWTKQKQREVYEKWKNKLKVKPFIRLPKVWKEYIKNPGRMLLKEERERSKELDTIYNNRVDLRCKDKKSMLLNGTMEDHVRQWLEDEKKNVMFILGEFGDGKTAFTYFLARNLAQEFLNDPDNGWIPVRLSLSDYQFARDPQTFLQRRLGEFNADPGSWNDLRNEKKKMLVILDGFDEMTPKLDSREIKKNIKDLTDCCNKEFKGMKIIITSRTHFFENKQDEKLLLQRLGNPPIFYLASVDRQKSIEYLEKSIADPQKKEVLKKLCKLDDPLALTSKPLFLQMFETMINEFSEEKPDESRLKDINEISMYETYIKKTLVERKIDLLDSEEMVDLENLVPNLKKILEQIAIKLQESNNTYISLERFSKEFGKKYDEILWEISRSGEQVNETENEKYDSADDAAARVQVRSLLTRVSGDNIKEKRPVKFCHRSMREYFVAKGICRALREDKKRAVELLVKLPLNHEILYFTAQLMKKDNSPNYKKNLFEITKSSLNSMTNESPGGNSITLLFRLLGALPGDDWSDLNLDGANLSGANLSRKNFRETSMRFANLDNVNFEEADFRNSDLTGVRIEETDSVLAVTTRYMGNCVFAAYKDNTIREWKNIDKPGRAVSEIVVDNTEENVIFLGFLHRHSLYAVTNEGLIFYDFEDNGKLMQKARFRLKPHYRKVVVKKDSLFHLSENKEKTNNVSLVDLNKFEEQLDLIKREKVILFDNLGPQAIALTDGKSGIGIKGTGNMEIPGNFNLPVHEPTSLSAHTCKTDREYLLACGQKDGEILLWKIKNLNDQWICDLLLRKQVHDGIVSSLSFLDDSTIVSGGVDRKISILRFDPNSNSPRETLQQDDLCLTIRCKGIKIDGLKGKKEYDMFKQFIKDQRI